jgi:hypothetical protein
MDSRPLDGFGGVKVASVFSKRAAMHLTNETQKNQDLNLEAASLSSLVAPHRSPE